MPALRRIRHALLVALVIALALPAAASAYAGQIPASITITGPTGAIACGPLHEFQATVFDSTGKRLPQEIVTWKIVAAPLGANDTITPSSTTDANGVAKASAAFGGAAGQRTIRATSGNAFAQIVVDPTNCGAPPPAGLNVGTCASALGLPPAGSYTAATKVQRLGGYITFRLSFGPQYAGKLVVVTRATRGVPFTGWGSWFGATGRIADANGDVYYWFRSHNPAWISVRGFIAPAGNVPGAISLACQGRWR